MAAQRLGLAMWASLAFALFALNNLILVLDRVVLLEINFWPWRQLPAALGALVLLYGMIRSTER